jgi:hypothetical protein
MTRLHARYGKDLTNDLVFEKAEAIEGGRDDGGSQGARAAGANTFQARYIIRHPWIGPIRCEHPVRGVWGGPPEGVDAKPVAAQTATGLAFVPRGGVKLESTLVRDVPELGVKGEQRVAEARKTGCGCNSSDPAGLAIALAALVRPKRRRARSIAP